MQTLTSSDFKQQHTFFLTLVDMTDKIDGHNLRFGLDLEMPTDKLDIRILREPVEQSLPRNHRFLCQLCPPCYFSYIPS